MLASNKHAGRDYEILERYEAGIVLLGNEVKAIKTQGIRLDGAFVKFTDAGLALINADVPRYKFSSDENYSPARSRQLLLHKKELLKIRNKLSQKSNLTIIPVSCYNKKGKIKLEIALAKGRKTWEKKRVEKQKDEKRRIEKEVKEYYK